MHWFNRGLIVLLLFSGFACETDPVIYLDQAPSPVIYGVFNSNDTVHYLKLGKSFGAETDPKISAQIFDSLFFNNAEAKIQVSVNGRNREVEPVEDIPKEAGLFLYPGQRLYRFETDSRQKWRSINVTVDIPGMPTLTGTVNAIRIGEIYTPKLAQQYIYLAPSSPWLVTWDGNPWNEIDVAFEFIEDLGDSVFQSKWVHIQNSNYFDSPHDKYREMKITYDEFIKEVLLQIPPNDSVEQIFFGNISIYIHGGDNNMVQYMKYINGYNDFNIQGFSNIENGLGILASRFTYKWDSLHFDYNTRQTLINENRLKVLKISPWN